VRTLLLNPLATAPEDRVDQVGRLAALCRELKGAGAA
jgi:hypothetical protein